MALTIRLGKLRHRAALSRPQSARCNGGTLWIRMSAPASRSFNLSRSAGSVRSSVTPRLSALRYRNRPLFSGSGISRGKGPRRRTISPLGGSTLITSAPNSAISLVQNAAATPCPHSTTDTSASGSCALMRAGVEILSVSG